MESKRLDYLDMAKGIGIILVVLGHAPYTADWLKQYIATFHMPLFFVISGILLCYAREEQKSYKHLFWKKCRTIFLPYICFSVIYLILDCLTVLLKPEKMTWVDVQRNSIFAFTLYGISVLWFLVALFWSELTFLWIRKKCNHIVTIVVVAALTLLSAYGKIWMDQNYPLFRSMTILCIGYIVISIFRGMIAMFFLALGYYVCHFLIEKREHNYPVAEWLVAGILFLVNGVVGRINGGVDLNFVQLNNPILYLISGGAGSLALILLCKQLPSFSVLRYFGKNSLIIMVTHLDFRVLISAIHYGLWMNQYVTRAKEYVLYLNVILAVIVLEVLWIYVINRFFPFLVGKRYQGIKSL